MTTNPNPTNGLYYNNQKYTVDLILVNPDGRQFVLNTAGLVNLQIVDDGLLWYKTGTLIIRNPENILEKRPDAKVPVETNYVFRNDGRDILIVKLAPTKDGTNPVSDLSPEDFNIEHVFTVYDKKDIPTGNSGKDRMLQLFFWETEYQVFYETNLDWSTNTVLPPGTISSDLSDEDRKVHTGDALKSLIKTTLGVPDTVFSKQWDTGASKIFYNSLANNNAIDDLEYILNRHTGSKNSSQQAGDPCFFYRERYSKKWTLQSLESVFSQAMSNRLYAGGLHKENVVLSGPSQSTNSNIPSPSQIPVTPLGSLVYSSKLTSVISNFQFEDMSALDNTDFLINYPCYSNNLKSKSFVLDFKDNTVDAAKQYIQNNYVNKLTTRAVPAIVLNNNKLNTKVVKQAYSFQKDKVARYADSRNKLLLSMLFFNQALVFTTPGTTFRRSNTFIGVNRDQDTIINNFDYKLLGQWFVNKVVHSFTEFEYTNTVYAVKLHTNEALPISDNV